MKPVAEALRERWPPALVVAFALLIWIPLVRIPFHLDETGIAWNIAGGAGEIAARAINGLPQSILYCYILWIFSLPFGPAELALRLPSVIASLGTLLILYRVGRRLVPESGVAAAMIPMLWLLIARPFALTVMARPYAVGMFFGALALDRCLVWMERRDRKSLAVFAVTAVIPFYFSFMFALTLPAYAIFLLWVRRRDGRAGIGEIVGVLVLWVVLMLPLAGQIMAVGARSAIHSMRYSSAGHPLLVLAPVELLACHAAALAVTLFRRRGQASAIPWTATLLSAMVVVAIILPLFLISQWTHAKLWLPRYYSVAFPALAVMHGVVFARRYDRKAAFCAIAAALAVVSARPLIIDYVREPDSYETIVHAIRAERRDTPVFVTGQFIEAWRWRFPVAPFHRDWLLAPFVYYRLEEPYEIVPYTLEQCDGDFAGKLVESIRSERRFLVATPGAIRPWMRDATAGYRSRLVVQARGYRVDVFEK